MASIRTEGLTKDLGDLWAVGHPIGLLATCLHRAGALIEAPALNPTLTGEANMQVFVRLGGHDHRRIAELLDVVGLRERGRTGPRTSHSG